MFDAPHELREPLRAAVVDAVLEELQDPQPML